MNLRSSQNGESVPDELTRECTLLVLYGLDVSDQDPGEFLTHGFAILLDQDPLVAQVWEDVEERVYGVHGTMELLNEQIQALSPRWRVERMATIDRNLLRLGIWEILEGKSSPLSAINGCVELAKSYGGEKTSGFVNGLLDQLCQNHQISIA